MAQARHDVPPIGHHRRTYRSLSKLLRLRIPLPNVMSHSSSCHGPVGSIEPTQLVSVVKLNSVRCIWHLTDFVSYFYVAVWIGPAANLRLVAYRDSGRPVRIPNTTAVALHGFIMVIFSNASVPPFCYTLAVILFRADAYYSAQQYLLSAGACPSPALCSCQLF